MVFSEVKIHLNLIKDLIENYNPDSYEGYFLEVDFQYLQKLHDLHSELLFLTGRMKIGKVEDLAADFYDKKEYVIHISNLKKILNHRIVLKKVQSVIKVNLKALLKSYIDMNTHKNSLQKIQAMILKNIFHFDK